MKAIKRFQGVPDGEFHPVTYEPGDDVPPELEAAARHFAGDDANADGKLSVDEIRAALTAKGIQFDPRAKKADLLALLPKD